MKQSPFDWQGKPSMFSSDPEFNGVKTAISDRARLNVKQTIKLSGSTLLSDIEEVQLNAYSKAKVAKNGK